MSQTLILASGSAVRAQLLEQARISHEVMVPRIDEEMIKSSLLQEDAKPRDIADALAEMKALKISEKRPGSLVLGCDQVLDFDGQILSKAASVEEAADQLRMLSGNKHSLLSAAVIYEDSQPVWRHVGQVQLRMRELSAQYLEDYLKRNWESIQYAVGCYKLEEEGARLFSAIQGDYFHVLGMPFLEIINYLTLRGDLAT